MVKSSFGIGKSGGDGNTWSWQTSIWESKQRWFRTSKNYHQCLAKHPRYFFRASSFPFEKSNWSLVGMANWKTVAFWKKTSAPLVYSHQPTSRAKRTGSSVPVSESQESLALGLATRSFTKRLNAFNAWVAKVFLKFFWDARKIGRCLQYFVANIVATVALQVQFLA